MKILFIITKGTWGGATRYVYDMARTLRDAGDTPAVAYGTEGVLGERLSEENIAQYRLGALTRNIGFFREIKAFRDILDIIDEFQPEVVHVNSSKGGLGALAAKVRGKRVVFTVHGWAFNERRNFISKFIFKLIYFATIFLSDEVILVSEALKNQIARWPFQSKLTVIYNGIEHPSFYSKEEARELISGQDASLRDKKNNCWVITIAELHDSKGIDIMFSALTDLRDEGFPLPQYVVLGDGEERWRLEKLITSYDLQENVHLLGFVKNASQYIPAADVFVLPSRTEALGYVLIEAGFAQVPIVATRVGGIPEVIQHNETGLLVPPATGSMLSVALQKVLSDKKDARRFAATLKERVEEKFSLEKMSTATREIYLKALRD